MDEKINILIVDDQRGKLLSYEAMLDQLDENLIKARSGTEALEQLLKTDIALVLMDVSMPRMDGFETAQMIHDHRRFQNTPIIFISGIRLQDEERRRIARELHDSVGQLLAAIGMNSTVVDVESYKLSPDAAKRLSENAALVEEASKQIRTISYLLHPPLLDETGLASALRWYVEGFSERSEIDATLDIPQNFAGLSKEMGAFHPSPRSGMPY